MANALTLLVQKLDTVARVVPTTFALILCLRKKFALTVSVCKKHAVSGCLTP